MKKTQTQKLLELLSDYKPHSTVEIMERVYGSSHLGLARVSARVYDLRQKGYVIQSKKDRKKPSICWYKMDYPSIFDTPADVKQADGSPAGINMIKSDDYICTGCALDSDSTMVDPRTAAQWTMGRCKVCRQKKYLTNYKYFNPQDDETV